MLEELKQAGFEIAKEIPYEYTVYDQKPGLDYELAKEARQRATTGVMMEKTVQLIQ